MDVFIIDRACISAHAYLWMAATSAREVKFKSVSQSTKITREDEGKFTFIDRVNKTFDLLHGIYFSVPVKDFRMWMADQVIVDLTGQEKGISGISFVHPLPVCRLTYPDIMFSYKFSSGDTVSPKFDDSLIYESPYEFLHPMYETSLLWNDDRQKLISENTTSIELEIRAHYPKEVVEKLASSTINF